MTIQTLIDIIDCSNVKWSRLDNLPCISTMLNGYSVGLCKYNRNGVTYITVDVDEFPKQNEDCLKVKLTKYDPHFKEIETIYDSAFNSSRNMLQNID